MKTLTVRLPARLMASIEAKARERRTTKSEVVRRRLEEAPGSPPASDTWGAAEELLKEAWASDAPARRSGYSNPHKQKTLDAIRSEKQHR